ncbi:MAG: hypothetical protein ABI867_19400 [Kofleriaceae bacterium]
MKRVVLVLALAQAGCISTASIARPNRVSLPIFFGAAAADFFVTSLLAAEVRDYTIGGSLATGAAVMAADIAVGCVLGGCAAFRP